MKNLIAASNQKMAIVGVSALNFTFSGDNQVLRQQFYVVKNFAPSIILGTDFMLRHDCEVSYKRKHMTCSKDNRVIVTPIKVVSFHDNADGPILNCFTKIRVEKPIKFNIAQDLDSVQKQELLKLLNEFRDIFSGEDDPIPTANARIEPARIELCDNIPVSQPPYRNAIRERDLINIEVERLLKAKVIRESKSAYASPALLVKKKGKQDRLVIDFRRLNKKVKDYKYPMPRVDDTLNQLNGAKFFTTLDLKNCFWQLPLDERDKHYTAFATGKSLYEWNCVPFGLKTAAAICQKAMYEAVRGLLYEYVLVYLDDWIIRDQTFTGHLIALRKVFERLREINLKLKPEKCIFGSRSVKVLGHKVSDQGITADENKLLSVKDFPIPKTVKHIRKFLGLSNYYRKFIPKYAEIAKPLLELTKKYVKFKWTESEKVAFETLKEKLMSAPVLRHFDPDLDTELIIDASDYGISAILAQKEKHEKSSRVVAYASRNLRGPETRYFTTEKELLGLVFGTQVYRTYLWGKPFTVITDHNSLRYWSSIKNPSSRLLRFVLRLSEYQFEVKHKAGVLNTAADALSRAPVDIPGYNPEEEEIPCLTIQIDELSKLQKLDKELAEIHKVITDPSKGNRQLNRKARRYILENDTLYKKVFVNNATRKVPVIPDVLKTDILSSLHDSPLTGGHLGRDKVFAKLRDRYFWERMFTDVEEYVRSCPECQARKRGNNKKPNGLLNPIQPPEQPFRDICIDILGPFTRAYDKSRYIITCVDYTTRYCEAKAVKDATAEEVATFLYEIITRHGAFQVLHSDRGTQFTSRIIANLIKQIGAKSALSTSYHPASQGVLERVHASLGNMLSMYVAANQKDWPCALNSILFAHNTSINRSTKFSPFELVYGRKPVFPMDTTIPQTDNRESHDERIEKVKQWREIALNNLQIEQEKMKENFDKNRSDTKFRIGDMVMVHRPNRIKGLSDKLLFKYHGPFTVSKVLSDLNYEIEGNLGPRKQHKEVVHVERLKRFYEDSCRKT